LLTGKLGMLVLVKTESTDSRSVDHFIKGIVAMESFRLLRWQKGVSLLEVLLSLVVISIILLIATQYFSVVNRNEKMNILRQQIGSLISAIESWRSEHSVYEATPRLSISTLLNEGFLAKSSFMKNTGTQETILNNPWGHQIVIERVTDVGIEISTELPGGSECRSLRNSYPDAEVCYSGIFRLHLPEGGASYSVLGKRT